MCRRERLPDLAGEVDCAGFCTVAVVGTAFVGKGANQPAESQFWSAGDARRRGSQTGQYGQDRVYLMWAIAWQGSFCSLVSGQQGRCCRT